MPPPVLDLIAHQLVPPQNLVVDQVVILKPVQDVKDAPLCSEAQPFCQFLKCADPFARINRVGDAIDPPVGGAEVGIGAEDGIIKKAGLKISALSPA